jgi:hypothetical protein
MGSSAFNFNDKDQKYEFGTSFIIKNEGTSLIEFNDIRVEYGPRDEDGNIMSEWGRFTLLPGDERREQLFMKIPANEQPKNLLFVKVDYLDPVTHQPTTFSECFGKVEG